MTVRAYLLPIRTALSRQALANRLAGQFRHILRFYDSLCILLQKGGNRQTNGATTYEEGTEMAATVLLATALLANAATMSAADAPTREWSNVTHQEVAFEELAAGQPEAAIAKIEANGAAASRDPAALINLGNAHARLGRTDKALEYYNAAIASDVRYDLELADGRWVDSRRAAIMARDSLLKRSTQALRQ